MNQDIFTAQIIGVFLAETVKNIAKGSANIVYENFHLFFDNEITALSLSDSINAGEITKRLELQPQILEKVQRKLMSHPTLAEEISKVIKEETGQSFTTINISSRNQKGGQTAHTIINNSLPIQPLRKVKIDINHFLEKCFDELEMYRLEIVMTNESEKPISNYRFEIGIPRAFLNDSTIINFENLDKRTEEYRFFRVTSENYKNQPLYFDDKRIIFSPNYYYTGILSYSEILKCKVYIDDKMIKDIEKPMRELVNR